MAMESITNSVSHSACSRKSELADRTPDRLWHGAFVSSFIAAGIFALVGLLFGADELLGLLSENSWMHRASFIGFGAAIVSLSFAAHCLDKLRELRVAARKERVIRISAGRPHDEL